MPFIGGKGRDWCHLFPHLPERTRHFRLFLVHQDLTKVFLAHPTVMGVIDAYGIELIHPIREGRSEQQIGKKDISFKEWRPEESKVVQTWDVERQNDN